MFTTNNNQPKASSIVQKRQQFRAQIRKQFLNQFFAQKRKSKLIQDINAKNAKDKQILLQKFDQLLNQFFSSSSNQQSQQKIKQIHKELIQQNTDYKTVIKQHQSKILKLFILYPYNKYAVHILFIMLNQCYQHTFDIDDKAFSILYPSNSFDVQIPKKQRTQYQQAMDTLMKTIDNVIQKLSQRKKFQSAQYMNQNPQFMQFNHRIQKGVRIYLTCLRILSGYLNIFILRYQYIVRYLTKWSKALLIDYNFAKAQILMYIHTVTRFIIPYQSISNQPLNKLTPQVCKIDEQIINKLFSLSVPQINKRSDDHVPYLSVIIIRSIFSYQQTRLQVIIHYMDSIIRLLRIVLFNKVYFKQDLAKEYFSLLDHLCTKFIHQNRNQDTSVEIKQKLRSVNLVKILSDEQFLVTFDNLLKIQFGYTKIVCTILHNLIDYSIQFDYDIRNILYFGNLFGQICHKLRDSTNQVKQINLNTIRLICEYADKYKMKQLFVRMVNYGVDLTLTGLQVHLYQPVCTKAIYLVDTYFDEEQVYYYTQLQNQLQRYDNQMELDQIFIPPRDQVYQI